VVPRAESAPRSSTPITAVLRWRATELVALDPPCVTPAPARARERHWGRRPLHRRRWSNQAAAWCGRGHILADQFMLASAPAKSGTDRASWVDFGRDNYAGVTFNGWPDNQRTAISWMNNWQCAGDVPTDPWRGQMTMPRRLSLASTKAGPRLRQTPAPGRCDPDRADRDHGTGRGPRRPRHGIRGRGRAAAQRRRRQAPRSESGATARWSSTGRAAATSGSTPSSRASRGRP